MIRSYNYQTFIKPIGAYDRNLKIYNSENQLIYTVNPHSIINTLVSSNLLKINLNFESIIIPFSTSDESKIALYKIQEQINILKNNFTINGLDGATGPTGATGPQGIAGINGLDGATGPTGAGQTPSLAEVLNVGNSAENSIFLYNDFGFSDYSNLSLNYLGFDGYFLTLDAIGGLQINTPDSSAYYKADYLTLANANYEASIYTNYFKLTDYNTGSYSSYQLNYITNNGITYSLPTGTSSRIATILDTIKPIPTFQEITNSGANTTNIISFGTGITSSQISGFNISIANQNNTTSIIPGSITLAQSGNTMTITPDGLLITGSLVGISFGSNGILINGSGVYTYYDINVINNNGITYSLPTGTSSQIATLSDITESKLISNQYDSNIIYFSNTIGDYYGKISEPLTGTLTFSHVGAVTGGISIIYYNNSTLDMPNTWLTIGNFIPNQINKIYLERDSEGNITANIINTNTIPHFTAPEIVVI